MKALSCKAKITATLLLLGAFLALPAQAAIVRSSDGAPVLSSNGNCVTTNWQGQEGCDAAKVAAGIKATAPAAAAKPQLVREHVIYFAFNKTTLDDVAQRKLAHLAAKIHKMNLRGKKKNEVTIVGYADRIGGADYNRKLSLQRATVVRDYLVSKGVKPGRIEIRALGKSDPVTKCPPGMKRGQLIDCLKEDRRVEIELPGGE